VFALEFPPINAVLRWKDIAPTFNKIALTGVLAAVIGTVIFLIAANRDGSKAPRGIRNLAETIVDFIEDGIVMQTLGRQGLRWTPFLLSLFVFIYLCNVPGVIPILQMPATARIAIPMMLSLLVWVTFIGTGLKHQGAAYFGHLIWPPGVPTALKPLVGLIEFVSTIIVTPATSSS
jgi:F-type H+-transporting ATPase subunit a